MSWSSSFGLSGSFSFSLSSSFFSSFSLSCSCTSGTARRSAASSVAVDLGFCWVSTTGRRFSSDHLCSASRRTLRAYTTPSSVRTRCSSVRSLLPCHTADFHLSCPLRCWISRSLSNFWKMCENSFSKFHRLSAVRSTHGTIERDCASLPSETGNEPGCVSDNPFHQSTVNGRSVLEALLHCCQHCAHLSLQLSLVVFTSSVALMSSSWRTSDDSSFLSFGFDTFCHLMSDGSGRTVE